MFYNTEKIKTKKYTYLSLFLMCSCVVMTCGEQNQLDQLELCDEYYQFRYCVLNDNHITILLNDYMFTYTLV